MIDAVSIRYSSANYLILRLAGHHFLLNGIEFFTELSDFAKRHSLLAFVPLGANEPECQSAGVVIRARNIRFRGSNAQRTFSPGLPPSATLHDHPHQDANRLPQSLAAMGVYLSQKPIDCWLRFQLPNDPGQRGPVMVNLSLLHPPLTVRIAEEFKHLFKGLLRVIHDVSKRFALSILKEDYSRDGDASHFRIPVIDLTGNYTYNI
jgi:hypothetical protein